MLPWLHFFPVSVLPHLLNLKKSRTISPDGFSAHTLFTLKPCLHCLAQPLGSLYEFFCVHNFVPDVWKVSFITPIHKKGSPNNFCPIAITSIICRVMHKQITHYLNVNLLITSSQHGFCTGKSAITNLLESTTDWFFDIDARNNIYVIYLDLTKAFDSVTYCKLLYKLVWFGL